MFKSGPFLGLYVEIVLIFDGGLVKFKESRGQDFPTMKKLFVDEHEHE